MPSNLANERGSSLIVVVIALSVMMVVAAAGISFTQRERGAAGAAMNAQLVASCAEAARSYMLAQLRTVGVAPTGIVIDSPLLDEVEVARQSRMRSGHFDQVSVSGVDVLSSSGFGASVGTARDITNQLSADNTLGGRFYRMVVHCESRGKQHELEFVVRFGL